ncbi:hypothetical protein GGX14DRAFT_620475 [Mycena pura]|uniref:Uncharacterized protein n=1 Tax=Mycena pura TaxID=153505 RepID=A0AAD6YF06_9AGAR|nr:hypothetical protein GGX14DRAFT_620475 [Mycena pura]
MPEDHQMSRGCLSGVLTGADQAFSSFVHGSRTRGIDTGVIVDDSANNIPNSHLRAADGDFVVCPLLRACRPSTQGHNITRQGTPRGGRVFGGRDGRGDGSWTPGKTCDTALQDEKHPFFGAAFGSHSPHPRLVGIRYSPSLLSSGARVLGTFVAPYTTRSCSGPYRFLGTWGAARGRRGRINAGVIAPVPPSPLALHFPSSRQQPAPPYNLRTLLTSIVLAHNLLQHTRNGLILPVFI